MGRKPQKSGSSEPALLNVANMALGVVSAIRRDEPPEIVEENIEWLEHALKMAFPEGDPFQAAATNTPSAP